MIEDEDILWKWEKYSIYFEELIYYPLWMHQRTPLNLINVGFQVIFRDRQQTRALEFMQTDNPSNKDRMTN